MIELRSLSVRFGPVVAVDDVSTDFTAEITGVIGPNGAGKTTLLNAIAGTVPSTGRIEIAGREIGGLTAYERARYGVRRTFQTDQVVRQLNVIENVRVGGEAQERSARQGLRGNAEDLLEFVGLVGASTRPATTLTNLERRKVEIARSLMGSTRVLLMDEPGAGLLADEKSELETIIRSIPKHHDAKVLLIEHDIDLVSRVCDRAIVLNFGQLIADGLPTEVLSEPAVRAAYLGESETTGADTEEVTS